MQFQIPDRLDVEDTAAFIEMAFDGECICENEETLTIECDDACGSVIIDKESRQIVFYDVKDESEVNFHMETIL